jgi:hypothetical protein
VGVDVSDPGELQELAERKVLAASGRAELGSAGRAAAALLTDLYRAGLRHGITPQDWAAVAALPTACWDATAAAIRAQQIARDRALRSHVDLAGDRTERVQAPELFQQGPGQRPKPRNVGRGR